jgi:hypothetical protein
LGWARIQAVLRRSVRRAAASPVTEAHSTTVRFGDLRLDIDARLLLQENGEELELTAMEFDLLTAFARNPNRVLTRERLLDIAYNRDTEPRDGRRRIERHGGTGGARAQDGARIAFVTGDTLGAAAGGFLAHARPADPGEAVRAGRASQADVGAGARCGATRRKRLKRDG